MGLQEEEVGDDGSANNRKDQKGHPGRSPDNKREVGPGNQSQAQAREGHGGSQDFCRGVTGQEIEGGQVGNGVAKGRDQPPKKGQGADAKAGKVPVGNEDSQA